MNAISADMINKNFLKSLLNKDTNLPKQRIKWIKNCEVHITPKGKISFVFRYPSYKTDDVNFRARKTLCAFDKQSDLEKIKSKVFTLNDLIREEKYIDPNLITLNDDDNQKDYDSSKDFVTNYYNWIDNSYQPTVSEKQYKNCRAGFKNHIEEKVSGRSLNSVSAGEWLDIFSGMTSKTTAKKVRDNLCLFLTKMQLDRKVDNNPLTIVTAKKFGYKAGINDNPLSDQHLHQVIWALEQIDNQEYKDIYWTLILFGCRPKEVVTIEGQDINRSFWECPPHKHKVGPLVGRDIKRPLSKGHFLHLKRITNNFQPGVVFKPQSDSTNWHRDMKVFDRVKKKIDSILSKKYETINTFDYDPIRHWVTYDIRTTFRTNFEEMTGDFRASEQAIGHFDSALIRSYNKHVRIDEMFDGYTKWFNKVEKMRVSNPFSTKYAANEEMDEDGFVIPTKKRK